MNSGQKHSARPALPPPLRSRTSSRVRSQVDRDLAPRLGRYVAAGVLVGFAIAAAGLWTMFQRFGQTSRSRDFSFAASDSCERTVSPADSPSTVVVKTAVPEKAPEKANGVFFNQFTTESKTNSRSNETSRALASGLPAAAADSPTAKADAHPTSSEPAAKPDATAARSELDPLASLREGRQRFLELPEFSPDAASAPKKLATLDARPPAEYQLTLLNPEESTTRLDMQAVDEPREKDARLWLVSFRVPKDSGESSGESIRVGEFALRGGQLTFHWALKSVDQFRPDELQLCLIEIAVAEQSVRCFLRRPLEADPDWSRKLNFNAELQQFPLPAGISMSDQVRFGVWIEGLNESHPIENVSLKETGSGSFELTSGDDAMHLDLIASVQHIGLANDRYQLGIKAVMQHPRIRRSSGRVATIERKEEKSPATIEHIKKESQIAKSVQNAFKNKIKDLEKKRARQEDTGEDPDLTLSTSRKQAAGKSRAKNRSTTAPNGGKKGRSRAPDDDGAEFGLGRGASRDTEDSERVTENSEDFSATITRLQEQAAEVNLTVDWLEKGQRLLEQLQNRGRIGFTAYVMNHGHRIVLMSTLPESAVAPKE